MYNHIAFSPRASLALTGMCIQQMGIWETIGQQVTIKQKVIRPLVSTSWKRRDDSWP